jgi:hypothetical protein
MHRNGWKRLVAHHPGGLRNRERYGPRGGKCQRGHRCELRTGDGRNPGYDIERPITANEPAEGLIPRQPRAPRMELHFRFARAAPVG